MIGAAARNQRHLTPTGAAIAELAYAIARGDHLHEERS